MNEMIVFVGGPLDGQLLAVESVYPHYDAPYATQVRVDARACDIVPSSPDFHKYRYVTMRLGHRWVGVPETMSPKWALDQILQRYIREKEAVV